MVKNRLIKLFGMTFLMVAAVDSAIAQAPRLHPNMEPVIAGDVGALFGPDAYPPAAIRAARQGRVIAELAVSATGAVTSCSIEESSGTTVLDETTCRIATTQVRFDPATDHDGHPVASTYRLPVRWALPDPPTRPSIDVTAGPPKEEIVDVEVTFDPGGVLLTCRSSTLNNPSEGIDPCAKVKIGTATGPRLIRNGKPIGGKVMDRFSEHVVPDP